MTKGRWTPGQSGNPQGRPPGSGEVGKLRAAIAARLPEILEKLAEQAAAGDVGAARLLMERVLPPLRAVEAAVPMAQLSTSGQSLSDSGRMVLAAVAAGQLAPGQGAALIASIGALSKVIEIDELANRVEALEARLEVV